jgi:copper homeostasis protein
MLLEICAANLASALAAERAGAHRVELCAALSTGGLTPSAGLIEAVLRAVSIPVHVLIRPREGDFVYSAREVEVMCADIRHCVGAGAAGVVVGALLADGRADEPALKAMQSAAGSKAISFHRAIDASSKPFEVLSSIIDLGFSHVLSAGGSPTAWEGRELLRQLIREGSGRVDIMPGSGITPNLIPALARETGAEAFHMSAKRTVRSGYPGVPGSGDMEEVSDERLIRKALDALCGYNDALKA